MRSNRCGCVPDGVAGVAAAAGVDSVVGGPAAGRGLSCAMTKTKTLRRNRLARIGWGDVLIQGIVIVAAVMVFWALIPTKLLMFCGMTTVCVGEFQRPGS